MTSKAQFQGSNEREILMRSPVEDTLMDYPSRALGDVPKLRFCLCCKASFWSEGFGQRICAKCKGRTAWRAAVPEGVSKGRSRSGGRST